MNFELLSPTITTNTVEEGKARTQAGKKGQRRSQRPNIISETRTHTHTLGCTIFNTLMI